MPYHILGLTPVVIHQMKCLRKFLGQIASHWNGELILHCTHRHWNLLNLFHTCAKLVKSRMETNGMLLCELCMIICSLSSVFTGRNKTSWQEWKNVLSLLSIVVFFKLKSVAVLPPPQLKLNNRNQLTVQKASCFRKPLWPPILYSQVNQKKHSMLVSCLSNSFCL